ncbi:MAG TPA: FHA domain-containing protein, partial [Nitrolancea sp.]|nr:FHA domain-containing protein [Nitrolancea sp.]
MAKLRIRVGDREYAFDDSQTVTIGRQADAAVPLSDALVSRRHAEVRADAQGWIFRDVGSSNGTYQDGKPVREVRIAGPLDLRLGDEDGGIVVHLEPESGGETQPRKPVELLAGVGTRPKPEPGPAPVPADDHPIQAFGEASFVYRPSVTMSRIGRAPENDVVINDLLVSRNHAELHREGGQYVLVDLDSANGTYVNGKRITRAPIGAGDYITIGHYLFRLAGGALEEYIDTGEITFEALDLTVRTDAGGVLLDDVSFSLQRCGLLAVVGPSGAGKSTLLNALTGFRPADDGRVLYNDRDLYDNYDDLRQRIGYVPQDDVLHPQLTVRRALQFAAALRFPTDTAEAERDRRVEEVMGELGLAQRADLPISRLSGGQRKRASIALELLTKPSLLFLDEPTSGLDPGYEKQIMTL